MEIRLLLGWSRRGGVGVLYPTTTTTTTTTDRILSHSHHHHHHQQAPASASATRRRRDLACPCRLLCSLTPVPVPQEEEEEEKTNSTTAVVGLPAASTSTFTSTSLPLKKRAADLLPELKGTSIFLLGTSSAIKSNLGRLLANTLRYYYFDSDDLVVEVSGGESAAKSFLENDEKGFRESETEVLKQLAAMGRLVVCAGDGAIQNSTNLGLLRHGISIWIDVPLDIIAKWVVREQDQVSGLEIESEFHFSEVLAQLMATYEEMRGGYATADATISLQNVATKLGYDQLDCVTTEDMAMEVLKEIEKLTRVKKMMQEAGKPF